MSGVSLLLIGCGNMGSALVRGWSKAGGVSVHIVEPHDLAPDLGPAVTGHSRDLDHLPPLSGHDVIFLAVKPQQMDDVLARLKPVLTPDTLVISIAAGRTCIGMSAQSHPDQPIIRAMPNLPAAIGMGITAAFASSTVSAIQKDIATQILSPAGQLVWITDENQMDAVTALSGSGPAYVFLLVEVMAKAGEHLGLRPDIAMQLARQTVIGSSALMAYSPELPASTLRQNVTSPGGTTSAALDILMKNAEFDSLMIRAIQSAENRARELKR